MGGFSLFMLVCLVVCVWLLLFLVFVCCCFGLFGCLRWVVYLILIRCYFGLLVVMPVLV